MRAKDVLGRLGEDAAASHLAGLGWTIIERNWRCPEGELDIVAQDGSSLVVCEVKTRSSVEYGTPVEAVTPAKAARLHRLAARWLSARGVGQVRHPHRCHRPRVRRLRAVQHRPPQGSVLTMALARTRAVALFGVDGQIVDVEAAITNGVPGLHLVGLPDTALSEARDRVRAAIFNSGEIWPNRHVTVSLFPASLPKRGSGFDLAIAIAVLAASEALPTDACAGQVMIGELGLDGRIRPVSGVLPAVLAAADSGAETVIVANGNAAEASLVPGLKVIGVGSLRALLARLRDLPPPHEPDDETTETAGPSLHADGLASRSRARRGDLDLADVRGQAEGRKILEISAAGTGNRGYSWLTNASRSCVFCPTVVPRDDPLLGCGEVCRRTATSAEPGTGKRALALIL